MRHLCLALIAAGCGGPVQGGPDPEGPPQPELLAPLVVTERGPRGGHLVFVDETGASRGDLTQMGREPLRDNSAAFSPDGRWVAFASSRGRATLVETSVWVIDALHRGQPRRITSGGAVELNPVWSPDGRWLVYSAQSEGGAIDLYRLAVAPDDEGVLRAEGAPVRLTDEPTQALHPSVSPDGSRIVFMALDLSGDVPASALRVVDWDGGPSRPLTEGPFDHTPSFSPDGTTIAFASRAEGRADYDLFLIGADGTERRQLLSERLGDQSGPVWSHDGRYLLCTSVYRAMETGKAAASSITYLDLRQRRPVLYSLQDPVAPESRSGVTLAPVALDAEALEGNQEYGKALLDWIEKMRRRSHD